MREKTSRAIFRLGRGLGSRFVLPPGRQFLGHLHDFVGQFQVRQGKFVDGELHLWSLARMEGSYVNTFSGNPHPTPCYEYNQIMYRLDLSDPAQATVTTIPEKSYGAA